MIRNHPRTPSRPPRTFFRSRLARSRSLRVRRALDLVLPTAWGAVAITFKLACPLAQQPDSGRASRRAPCSSPSARV